MIFNSYIKFSLIVFLAVLFSACEKKGTGSKEEEEGRSEHSEDSSPKPKEEEGPGVKEPPKDPPSLPEDKKEEEPSKGAPPSNGPKKNEAEVSSPQEPSKAEVEPDNEQAAALAEIKKIMEQIPDSEKHFTFKEFKATGLLGEEDQISKVSGFYIYYFVTSIDNSLRKGLIHPQDKEYLEPFCGDKNDCTKGVDLGKLTRSHIARLLRFFGFTSPDFGYITDSEKPDDEPIPFYILHSILEYMKEDGQTEKISIEEHIEMMKTQKIKKIAINLSAPRPDITKEQYFLLGRYIKEQEAELYIEGRCSYHCFNYLLPAAKKIYIGPYGHISSKVFAQGVKIEMEKILSLQLQKLGEKIAASYFAEDNIEGLVGSFQNSFQERGEVEDQRATATKSRILNRFLALLENWEEGTGKEIKGKLNDFLYNKGYGTAEESLPNLSGEEIEEFLNSLSPEERMSLRRSFFWSNEVTNPLHDFLGKLNQNISMDFQYYNKTGVGTNLNSKAGYSFFDFLNLSTFLVNVTSYTNFFSVPGNVPRSYYSVSEEDKFLEVAPSADLLRSLGFNVQGENNIGMFRLYHAEKQFGPLIEPSEYAENLNDKVLYLDEKRMENCDFFAETATYTKESLEGCLNRE